MAIDPKLATLNASFLGTLKVLKTAVDATMAAMIDHRTASTDLATFIASLDSQQPATTPIDVPPANAQIGITPELPRLPSTYTTSTTTGMRLISDYDGGGNALVLAPTADWQVIADLAAKGVKLTRLRPKSVKRIEPLVPGKTYGITVSAPDCVAEDIAWLDDSGMCFQVAADNFTARRISGRTFSEYLFYLTGKNFLIEDLTIADDGPDGIPNTADDDGGSDRESDIRLDAGTSGTIRRALIRYRGKSRKACLRGFGDIVLDGCVFDGAITGVNPLDAGDGGQNWLWDRVLINVAPFIVHVDNPDVCIQAMTLAVAEQRAKGQVDQMALARVFRAAAKVTVNGARYTASDLELQNTISRRAYELNQASSAKAINGTQIIYGLAWKAGAVYDFDHTCAIIGSPEGGDTVFTAMADIYPEANRLLPGDKLRDGCRITLRGTPLVGKNGLGIDADTARRSMTLLPGPNGEVVTMNGKPLILA